MGRPCRSRSRNRESGRTVSEDVNQVGRLFYIIYHTHQFFSFVSHKCRGASLLALTGDSAFHKHLQSQANQSGLLLNEYGLWKWNQNSPSDSTSTDDDAEADAGVYDSPEKENGYWSLVRSSTENDIFEELGIDFIEPSKRNFSFISAKGRKKRGVGPPF